MIEKSTILVICIHKRVKSLVFAVSIKFCDESGLAIKSEYIYVIITRGWESKDYFAQLISNS